MQLPRGVFRPADTTSRPPHREFEPTPGTHQQVPPARLRPAGGARGRRAVTRPAPRTRDAGPLRDERRRAANPGPSVLVPSVTVAAACTPAATLFSTSARRCYE